MSVYITDFQAWTVVHDDPPGPHTGTIDSATITHPTNKDGTENHEFLIVVCPVCDSFSTHPVGGGAQPVPVQSLFTVIAYQRGCPCGQLTVANRGTVRNTASHVEGHCADMDGPERWQLDDAVLQRLEALLA